MNTLAIAPEGKFPVRKGTRNDAEKFVKGWAKLSVGVDRKAPLTELYPADVINNIVAGLETASRWGVREGQLSMASKIINSQVFNRRVREYIDGTRSLDETVRIIKSDLNRIWYGTIDIAADARLFYLNDASFSSGQKRGWPSLRPPFTCPGSRSFHSPVAGFSQFLDQLQSG